MTIDDTKTTTNDGRCPIINVIGHLDADFNLDGDDWDDNEPCPIIDVYEID